MTNNEPSFTHSILRFGYALAITHAASISLKPTKNQSNVKPIVKKPK